MRFGVTDIQARVLLRVKPSHRPGVNLDVDFATPDTSLRLNELVCT
jgi:hypothetical protein